MTRPSFLIVNPTSGSYRAELLERMLATLRQGGLVPELLPTTCAEDAPRFASRICAETVDPLILVAGGDGTVNGVLNGLAPGVATLGVLPMGTSNVLARELKIFTLEEALRRVLAGESRAASAGERENAAGTRRFLLMAGVGVDGTVVEGVRLAEKKTFGKGAYALSALRTMANWDRGKLQVTGGGRSESCHSVIVCNASRYGGNFLLAPKADLFSPEFQVLCINGGRTDYVKLALLLAAGAVTASPSVVHFPARELEVAGTKSVQLDGDFFGSAPLKLRSLPGFLRLIV